MMRAYEFLNPLLEQGLSFMGYPCTQDCSGHQAGYNYAKYWGITDPNLCPYGNSNSFWEGCKAGASEQ